MTKLKLKEKIGYALGDGAANIAWRGVATFLFIFYTDVFGLNPITVGILFLVARFSDGISDVLMGIIGDRTQTKYGKFRPWILWTAIPLAVMLSLLFTNPGFSTTGKIIYAYITYILFTLIYTANNIPYGALMAVMTGDDKERASLGSYRMVGAFAGGMLVQGALLYLVASFGNINPNIQLQKNSEDRYEATISSKENFENVNIKTDNGIALFAFTDTSLETENAEPVPSKTFSVEANKIYKFTISGEKDLKVNDITIINQKKGYSNAMYAMSVVLAILLLITFFSTKERVLPPKTQKNNLKQDFKDLIHNKPWLILLIVGLLFNIYNSIKQGIIIIYFTHYLNNQLLSASFLVSLMIASILGAMATAPLSKRFGKKNLFIGALLFSGIVNSLFIFCNPDNIKAIFTIGILSEFAAAIFPTLFFVMLGDAADYSEYKNKRRATGLIYSAGSFATKFGGGIAGAIIGLVLGMYHYNGQDTVAIQGAIPGILMLMSWIPAIITAIAAGLMTFYPLTQSKITQVTQELYTRRQLEQKSNTI
ncbi:MFS transporter [Polaribacter batillariae]|uniref:MFS transporter n=1 Tax=Polaribacter batillariae TaxID=2808900 RepID=A0ABX7ST30_9FLAO|nr:MFS transporter [Polaribacter batillariae]QTD37400.1 MFS transporter [Polaribacter batillariae]